MNSYKEVLNYLYNQLPMFQRSGPPAYKHSLDNTFRLDELYEHPHRKYKTIHVAGTNGKGSVSHMLAAILQKAGYKTGLYTSPHLKDLRERIRIDGEMIQEKEIIEWTENFMNKNKSQNLDPSFFELTVAMAFDYFSQKNVDIAVIEVGLGGRLDSTNIITPELSIITNISYDHTALLGNTLEKIAFEKAGIIKEGIPVVIGQTQHETEKIFIKKAREKGAPVYFADQEFVFDNSMIGLNGKQILNISRDDQTEFSKLEIGLSGLYQRKNVVTILEACELLQKNGLNISKQNIYDGLSEVVELTGIKGRWQVVGNNPLIVCDTGHNEDGIRAVTDQINQTAFKKLHFVFGTVEDKDISKILELLPKNAVYYFTKANVPRALNEVDLKIKATGFGLNGKTFPSVKEAFEAANEAAEKEDFIFVGGSTFVVAEILN